MSDDWLERLLEDIHNVEDVVFIMSLRDEAGDKDLRSEEFEDPGEASAFLKKYVAEIHEKDGFMRLMEGLEVGERRKISLGIEVYRRA